MRARDIASLISPSTRHMVALPSPEIDNAEALTGADSNAVYPKARQRAPRLLADRSSQEYGDINTKIKQSFGLSVTIRPCWLSRPGVNLTLAAAVHRGIPYRGTRRNGRACASGAG
jgi:hypothetical protein